MPTSTPRLNITVPSEISALLLQKAKNNKTSMSKVALDLIIDAMERDEDLYFSQLAGKRERTSKKRITHEDAWK